MTRISGYSLRSLLLLAGMLVCFAAMPLPVLCADQPAWVELHSPHFTVVTDGGDKKGREVALRFEQMRAVFGGLLMRDRLTMSAPLTILAFKNDDQFYRTAPLRNGRPIAVPGFFISGDDQNFFVLNLSEDEPWRAVAHQFAHLLLNSNYPPAQGWFDEGLADYFSSIRVDNKQFEIGSDPELNSAYTENAASNQTDARNAPKSLTELLNTQTWLSIPELFATKRDTSTYQEGTHLALFYAGSWMVMHYLMHEKKLPETGQYFDLALNQHLPVEDAILKAYGVTAAQFEQAVKDYFHSFAGLSQTQNAPGSRASSTQAYGFPVPVGPDDVTITTQPLSADDARALAAEVMVRVPERREPGMKELQSLTTPPPASDSASKKWTDNEIAHRVLAWDDIQHSDFDAAAQELSTTATLNARDTWIRYYLSLLKYRLSLAHHGEIQGLANMIQDLRAVVGWYPEFAEAHNMMAMAQSEGGGATGALLTMRAAMRLSPRNEQYVYNLAQIYIAGRKFDAAKNLLDRLQASGNPQIAAAAHQRLEEMATVQKYGIGPAANAQKLAPQKSPFDVLDEEADRRARQQQATAPDTRPIQYAKGRLVSVDCSQAPVAILMVNVGGRTLRLRTADYKSLLLIGADTFSCDWSNRNVSVNYKPGGLADGDLVSVEVR